jgi:23S rRNA pseudouridine2605 synthase
VNGKSVTELGTKVNPGDDVRYNGERIRNERKVYLLLNKPKDYVTTTEDPKERKTVMLLIRNACRERIYPVGRLDRNTTGVLLFTNDGEMAKRLTHPGYNKKKIYHVFLDRGLSAGDMKKLAGGINLEDGFIQPDAISYASSENRKEVGLELHSGRNRIVRRMFESLGYRVVKLDRVYFAGLTKKNLPRGKWRFLTEKEINRLKMNAYE